MSIIVYQTPSSLVNSTIALFTKTTVFFLNIKVRANTNSTKLLRKKIPFFKNQLFNTPTVTRVKFTYLQIYIVTHYSIIVMEK